MRWPRWLRRWRPEPPPIDPEHIKLAERREAIKGRVAQHKIQEGQRALDSFTSSVERAMRGQSP